MSVRKTLRWLGSCRCFDGVSTTSASRKSVMVRELTYLQLVHTGTDVSRD